MHDIETLHGGDESMCWLDEKIESNRSNDLSVTMTTACPWKYETTCPHDWPQGYHMVPEAARVFFFDFSSDAGGDRWRWKLKEKLTEQS